MKAKSVSFKHTMSLCKGKNRQHYRVNPPDSNIFRESPNKLPQKKQAQAPYNFILANKKNLRNFFQDRLPKENITIEVKNDVFSPTKIFNLRKQQNLKQDNTKITLNKSIQMNQYIPQTPEIKKLNETFHVSNNKLQYMTLHSGTCERILKTQYSTITYQTPTSSSIVKRSSTAKKKAYESVFVDQEEISKLLQIESSKNLPIFSDVVVEKKRKPRPKTQTDNTVHEDERKHLDRLLHNIQQFSKGVNPHRCYSKNDYSQSIQAEKKREQHQTQIINWVKHASEEYKDKNISMKAHKLRTVEDVERIDPVFYLKMKNHKNSRLWVRNKALYSLKNDSTLKKFEKFQRSHTQIEQQKQDNEWMDNILTLTNRSKNAKKQQVKKLKSLKSQESELHPSCIYRKQKFSNFGNNLIKGTQLARLYSIKIHNIYLALWKKRKPFQLQGSYAFFKFIKAGKLASVDHFIFSNLQYAYQIDNEGRTALIYAVQNNWLAIVKYLMETGINLDAETYEQHHTALYYALKNRNYHLSEALLQGGASPWSTNYYSIDNLLTEIDNQFRILIKNARRIHIARNLFRKLKQKDQFWRVNKNKIQGAYLINFQ